jgi:hypothetical protein
MYLEPTEMTCITAIRVSWTILYAFDFHYPYLISEATLVVRFTITCISSVTEVDGIDSSCTAYLCCVAYKSRTTNLGLFVGKSTLLYFHTVMAIGLLLLHVYCTEAQGSHPSSLRKNNLLKAGFLDYFHLLWPWKWIVYLCNKQSNCWMKQFNVLQQMILTN